MSRARTFVTAEILMLVGLMAYIAIAVGLERMLNLQGPVTLSPISALALSCIPAFLWLGYFHSQDRLEPEPKAYVFGSFLLGAFVAAPCAGFLVDLTAQSASFHLSFDALSVERWVFAIAIVGLSQELCKYLVVRYSLYVSKEFDEPLDGIIYMSASGIGFAVYESYHFLLSSDGSIYLSAGATQTVVTTLAHASFAGVVGFALGHAKFIQSSRRSALLITGIVAAGVLNGGFHMILDGLSTHGLTPSPWRRVLFSLAFAAVVFLLISFLMRKLLAISPHHPKEQIDG